MEGQLPVSSDQASPGQHKLLTSRFQCSGWQMKEKPGCGSYFSISILIVFNPHFLGGFSINRLKLHSSITLG